MSLINNLILACISARLQCAYHRPLLKNPCSLVDFEKVINHHLQHDSHKSALDVLAKQHDMELFYKFSPILMQNVPNDTVDAWINKGKQLDPKRLIPAIVQYDHAKQRTQVSLSLNVYLWTLRYYAFSMKPCSHITFAVTATLKFALCQWSNTYSNKQRTWVQTHSLHLYSSQNRHGVKLWLKHWCWHKRKCFV